MFVSYRNENRKFFDAHFYECLGFIDTNYVQDYSKSEEFEKFDFMNGCFFFGRFFFTVICNRN